mmetsp:Transcript_3346/g.8040  ORF Transcript_3346/g.8040 Transcript_3346/m.8040 type:complete len:212 (+) Transcript_3346:2418-3053(+)
MEILCDVFQCCNCQSKELANSTKSCASFACAVCFETTSAWPPSTPRPEPRVRPGIRTTLKFPAMPSLLQSAMKEGQCRANMASPRSQKRRRTSVSRNCTTSSGEIGSNLQGGAGVVAGAEAAGAGVGTAEGVGAPGVGDERDGSGSGVGGWSPSSVPCSWQASVRPQIQSDIRRRPSTKAGLSTRTPPSLSTKGFPPWPEMTSIAMHMRPS